MSDSPEVKACSLSLIGYMKAYADEALLPHFSTLRGLFDKCSPGTAPDHKYAGEDITFNIAKTHLINPVFH